MELLWDQRRPGKLTTGMNCLMSIFLEKPASGYGMELPQGCPGIC